VALNIPTQDNGNEEGSHDQTGKPGGGGSVFEQTPEKAGELVKGAV